MESSKTCPKCKKEKLLSEFSKSKNRPDGLQCYCKECLCKIGKERYQKNPSKQIAYSKKYRQVHKKECAENAKKYYQEHKKERKLYNEKYIHSNKSKLKAYRKARYQNDPVKYIARSKAYARDYKYLINKRCRDRRKTDIAFRIHGNISASMRQNLKTDKNGKSWENYIDYTLKDLIKRLKSTLPKGYTWNDYVSGANLHIDHIIPKSAFNITSIECTDFKKCWALKNLRLLPALENMSKGAKLINSFQPSLAGF